jgi:hypothetical protein
VLRFFSQSAGSAAGLIFSIIFETSEIGYIFIPETVVYEIK